MACLRQCGHDTGTACPLCARAHLLVGLLNHVMHDQNPFFPSSLSGGCGTLQATICLNPAGHVHVGRSMHRSRRPHLVSTVARSALPSSERAAPSPAQVSVLRSLIEPARFFHSPPPVYLVSMPCQSSVNTSFDKPSACPHTWTSPTGGQVWASIYLWSFAARGPFLKQGAWPFCISSQYTSIAPTSMPPSSIQALAHPPRRWPKPPQRRRPLHRRRRRHQGAAARGEGQGLVL